MKIDVHILFYIRILQKLAYICKLIFYMFLSALGEIEIELWTKETPKACRNFIQLIMEGYYNNTSFHRLIPGFMIQGGDPTGTGKGK